MPGHDIIVIGASAGGVEALKELTRGLEADLPAALFVVLHIPAQGPSMLPAILTRSGPLKAVHPHDGDSIQNGRIYIAPPDHHLLVERGQVRVTRGPKENRHRPAVDPLFRSAALAYGPRVVGVVLTGFLDDGTAGLMSVKARGGVAVVQDPADALYPPMPRSALENVDVDYCLPLSEMSALIGRLAHEEAVMERDHPAPESLEIETGIARNGMSNMEIVSKLGKPSVFSCPDCNGTLWELREAEMVRFRCQVGHAYTSENLLVEQADGVEAALWAALRAMEENITLTQRMARRARDNKQAALLARFEDRIKTLNEHTDVMRKLLRENGSRPQDD